MNERPIMRHDMRSYTSLGKVLRPMPIATLRFIRHLPHRGMTRSAKMQLEDNCEEHTQVLNRFTIIVITED